ncbi:MAG TPA: twin transmembrane helix small protein [Burkholderiaceae bacterium]|nr:twin transmembrane helix small protein [Burkholderiaceae bacterium]
MQYFILVGFIAILASLGAAMFYMLKNGKNDLEVSKTDPQNMARSLAFRVGFSILLFVCILVAWMLGYIQPTGIQPGQ